MDNSNKNVDALEQENVDVEVETSDNQPNNHISTNRLAMPSRLQQIQDDNDDMPLPMGMAEVISNGRVEVEQIDDDNVGPEPPAMLEESLNASDPEIARKVSATLQNNLSSVNDQSSHPPVPFDSAEYEDTEDVIAKKKATKDEMNQQRPAAVSNNNEVEGEEVLIPTDRCLIFEPSTDIEGGEGMSDNTNTNTERGDTSRRGWEDVESRVARQDIESQTRTDNNEDTADIINNDLLVDMEANAGPSTTNQAAGDTDIHIPDAFLVEDRDEEVYDATPLEPTLPWWKQRRAKIFFGVLIVLVGALVIALGLSLSQSNNPDLTTVTVFVTPPPTISLAPSLSIAPSTSSPPTRIFEATTSFTLPAAPTTTPPTTTPPTSVGGQSTPSPSSLCFAADDGGIGSVLYEAVRDQDCVNNQECEIAQTYGWPMNSWCVESVKDMSYLFYFSSTFNEDINGWNTSSVTDMSFMFKGASSFNQDLSNFDTSSVTNMEYMFSDASSFNRGLSNFNTSSVTNMRFMFSGASAFNQDVSSFDTSSVTNIFDMFKGASSFNQDLCSWQDRFPYSESSWRVNYIFLDSNCTHQDSPTKTQNGPFCASDCQ